MASPGRRRLPARERSFGSKAVSSPRSKVRKASPLADDEGAAVLPGRALPEPTARDGSRPQLVVAVGQVPQERVPPWRGSLGPDEAAVRTTGPGSEGFRTGCDSD